MNIHGVGFETTKDGYLTCLDFDIIYQEIQDDHCQDHIDFIICDNYVFREDKLRTPYTYI